MTLTFLSISFFNRELENWSFFEQILEPFYDSYNDSFNYIIAMKRNELELQVLIWVNTKRFSGVAGVRKDKLAESLALQTFPLLRLVVLLLRRALQTRTAGSWRPWTQFCQEMGWAACYSGSTNLSAELFIGIPWKLFSGKKQNNWKFRWSKVKQLSWAWDFSKAFTR